MNLRSKRKYTFKDCSKTKKIRLSKRRDTIHINDVINLGMPHIGEQIFASLLTDNLIQCLEVSQTWSVLAENVILTEWKGKLFEACEIGKKEIVKLLLENYNSQESGLNVKSECGMTPFMVACQNGHKDVVKILLDYSSRTIDLNATDDWEYTAFMWACDKGHKDVVKLLLDNSEGNIDFNARNNIRKTSISSDLTRFCRRGIFESILVVN